jgi:hypothetical protein
VEELIEQLRAQLAPAFPGRQIGALTGGLLHWPSVQNKRGRGEIPDECFCYQGRRVIVLRDPFLNWWISTLTQQRPALPGTFRKSNRKQQPSLAHAAEM